MADVNAISGLACECFAPAASERTPEGSGSDESPFEALMGQAVAALLAASAATQQQPAVVSGEAAVTVVTAEDAALRSPTPLGTMPPTARLDPMLLTPPGGAFLSAEQVAAVEPAQASAAHDLLVTAGEPDNPVARPTAANAPSAAGVEQAGAVSATLAAGPGEATMGVQVVQSDQGMRQPAAQAGAGGATGGAQGEAPPAGPPGATGSVSGTASGAPGTVASPQGGRSGPPLVGDGSLRPALAGALDVAADVTPDTTPATAPATGGAAGRPVGQSRPPAAVPAGDAALTGGDVAQGTPRFVTPAGAAAGGPVETGMGVGQGRPPAAVPAGSVVVAASVAAGQSGTASPAAPSSVATTPPAAPAASAGQMQERQSGQDEREGHTSRQSEGPGARVEMPASAPTTAPVDGAPPATESAATRPAVFDQVVRGIRLAHAGGRSEIYLQLDPPSLGELHIRLTVQGDQVHVHLRTASGEVRGLLDGALTQLRQALADQGLRVEGLQVSLGQGGGPGFGAGSGGAWQGTPARPEVASRWPAAVETAPAARDPGHASEHVVDYRV